MKPDEVRTSDSGATVRHGIDRRTLVKGAAWALPVLAVSVAAPLAAASVDPTAYALRITSLEVAPTRPLHEGDPYITPDLTFNTFVTVVNDGPDPATGVRLTLTFGADAVTATPFTPGPGWTLGTVTTEIVGGIERYFVEVLYTGTIAVGESVTTYVAAHCRLPGAFNTGYTKFTAGAYAWNDPSGFDHLTDDFYVLK